MRLHYKVIRKQSLLDRVQMDQNSTPDIASSPPMHARKYLSNLQHMQHKNRKVVC